MKEFFIKLGKFVWGHKISLFIFLIIIASAIYFFYGKKTNSNQKGEKIQTIAVKKGDVEVTATGSGQIYAKSQVDLKGVVAGDGIDVVEVDVKDGQEVKKGDLIAVLDTTEPMKQVRNAKLGLESAIISQKQTENQYDTKTKEDKWTRQLQEISVQEKQNSLADAEDKLKDYYIRAPFDGIVTDLNVEIGDSISQSDIIASIITKEMYAKISLNEVDAAKVKKDNDVLLTLDALSGFEIKGKISRINTIGEISQNVVSYDAEVDFISNNEMLKPGMSVDAKITIESKRNVLNIPNSLIKKNTDGSKYVEVMPIKRGTGNSAKESLKKKIEVGISNDSITEIVSGLQEGDEILKTTGNVGLNDNENEARGSNFFGGGMGGMRR